ncbi:MAG: ABC transporter ATP-binding protein [Myxococcota bacterium]
MNTAPSDKDSRDPVLHVDQVYKSFATHAGSLEVLSGVDLVARRGDTVAILGESGSGKSTLLSLLAGLDAPTRGRVIVEGHDLDRLDEAELARFRAGRLSIVFQQFHLMGGLTALENVSLPLELQGVPEAEARAHDALAQVGLQDRSEHLPSRLSGGECQRVAIARALVVEPALLLADEPSGSLDARTGGAVTELLFDLVETHSTTLILVTHNETLAARCIHEHMLMGGRLAQQR